MTAPGRGGDINLAYSEFDTLPPYRGIMLESAPVDEFTAKLKERQRMMREGAEK